VPLLLQLLDRRVDVAVVERGDVVGELGAVGGEHRQRRIVEAAQEPSDGRRAPGLADRGQQRAVDDDGVDTVEAAEHVLVQAEDASFREHPRQLAAEGGPSQARRLRDAVEQRRRGPLDVVGRDHAGREPPEGDAPRLVGVVLDRTVGQRAGSCGTWGPCRRRQVAELGLPFCPCGSHRRQLPEAGGPLREVDEVAGHPERDPAHQAVGHPEHEVGAAGAERPFDAGAQLRDVVEEGQRPGEVARPQRLPADPETTDHRRPHPGQRGGQLQQLLVDRFDVRGVVRPVPGEVVVEEAERRLDLLDDLDQLLRRHPQVVVADDHPVDERVDHGAVDVVDRLERGDEPGEVGGVVLGGGAPVLEVGPALGRPDPPRASGDARDQRTDGTGDESHEGPRGRRPGEQTSQGTRRRRPVCGHAPCVGRWSAGGLSRSGR
jgi:hypothetical protein